MEHYAYQRLFEALKLPFEEVMRLRTTVKPADVAKCARRVFIAQKVTKLQYLGKNSIKNLTKKILIKILITDGSNYQNILSLYYFTIQ